MKGGEEAFAPGPDDEYKLSKAQRRVATLIVRGAKNKEIAAELNMSLSTVKTHINNVYDKTKVYSRSGLAALVPDRFYLDGVHVELLTKRQRRIFEMSGYGAVPGQIAHALDIKASTVRSHQEAIRKRLNLNNLTALAHVSAAWRHELEEVAMVTQEAAISHLYTERTNPERDLVRSFVELGYIDRDDAEHSYVMAKLAGQEETMPWLLNPRTEPIVREIVAREVELYPQSNPAGAV
jgi:DNA-binding NarL/FixJ family response regulator